MFLLVLQTSANLLTLPCPCWPQLGTKPALPNCGTFVPKRTYSWNLSLLTLKPQVGDLYLQNVGSTVHIHVVQWSKSRKPICNAENSFYNQEKGIKVARLKGYDAIVWKTPAYQIARCQMPEECSFCCGFENLKSSKRKTGTKKSCTLWVITPV
jgi:hypothetical protein